MSAEPVTREDVHALAISGEILCVTQHPAEQAVADPAYLEVCARIATRIARSVHCAGTGCGGHPICTPCDELAHERGLSAALSPSGDTDER